ncbi:MAG TPA: energy-coupled thiamine transporter ThiT [Bacillota bacterium]|nr:energy-coupled thiamine transporter ThiT [Bacillota bacterium]
MTDLSWLRTIGDVLLKTENVLIILAIGVLIYLLWLTNPSRTKSTTSVRPAYRLTEIGVTVALSMILSMISIYRMPQGGSISLEMLPIFYVALRSGGGVGIMTGLTFGLLKLLLGPFVVHPLQLILDYPLAFAFLGLAGFFRRYQVLGIILGGLGRFAMHVISGAVFFATYAPEGTNVWVYSATYNASYMVPELIISIVVMLILGLGPRTRTSSRRG